jgi:hypothetical protein
MALNTGTYHFPFCYDFSIDLMRIDLSDSLRHNNSAEVKGVQVGHKFYFHCVQRTDTARLPVSINHRKRNQSTMPRFNCKGCITVYVPLETVVNGLAYGSSFVGVQYKHAFHQRKRRTKISNSLKAFIKKHVFLGARQIYGIFRAKITEFPDDQEATQDRVCNFNLN